MIGSSRILLVLPRKQRVLSFVSKIAELEQKLGAAGDSWSPLGKSLPESETNRRGSRGGR